MKNSLLIVALLFIRFAYGQENTYEYVSEKEFDTHSAEFHFSSSQKLYDEGFYESAILESTKAIEKKPRYIEAFYLRALSKELINDKRGALLDYEIVLKIDPTFSEALLNRGMIHHQVENYSLAIEDFRALQALPPKETSAIFFKDGNLGSNPDESTISSISSLSSTNMKAELFNLIGMSLIELEMFEEAIKSFDEAISLNNQSPEYFVNRGFTYSKIKNNEQAIVDFKQALYIEPNYAQAIYNLSILVGEDGEIMLDIYKKSVNSQNKMPEAYHNRGFAYYQEGKFGKAIADYDTAIYLDNSSPEMYINRGLALDKLKKYYQAIEDFSKALHLDPNWPKCFSSRGNTYFKLKLYSKAIEDYNRAIQLDRQNPNVYYNRGLAYYQTNNKEAACKDLQTAYHLDYQQAEKALKAYCH